MGIKKLILGLVLITITTTTVITFTHYYPSKQMSAFREDTINQILLAQNCSNVEKIYNDNNSILGDGLILQYAKDRLDLGKFPHKDCIDKSWDS